MCSPLSRRHDHDAAGLPRWHHPHDAEHAPLLGVVAGAEARRCRRPCSLPSSHRDRPPPLHLHTPPPVPPFVAVRVPTVGRASLASFFFFHRLGVSRNEQTSHHFFPALSPRLRLGARLSRHSCGQRHPLSSTLDMALAPAQPTGPTMRLPQEAARPARSAAGCASGPSPPSTAVAPHNLQPRAPGADPPNGRSRGGGVTLIRCDRATQSAARPR